MIKQTTKQIIESHLIFDVKSEDMVYPDKIWISKEKHDELITKLRDYLDNTKDFCTNLQYSYIEYADYKAYFEKTISEFEFSSPAVSKVSAPHSETHLPNGQVETTEETQMSVNATDGNASGQDLNIIDRIEIIDEKGRQYVAWDVDITEYRQDGGKTLKIHVKNKQESVLAPHNHDFYSDEGTISTNGSLDCCEKEKIEENKQKYLECTICKNTGYLSPRRK